jgi:hypothetical protein
VDCSLDCSVDCSEDSSVDWFVDCSEAILELDSVDESLTPETETVSSVLKSKKYMYKNYI